MDNQNTTQDQANPTSTPSAQAPTGVPTVTPSKKGSAGKFLAVLVVLLLVAAAAFAGYKLSDNNSKKEIAELNSKIAAKQAKTHVLPEGAIKLSECIPNMGAHYLAKGADPEYGPFLLVNKAGQVIGTEFMASVDMYSPIPGVVPPVSVLMKDSPLYGWEYDHAELSHTPQGHEGFEKDHIDFHIYTVTPDEKKQACV